MSEPHDREPTAEQRQVLLAEYQAAQASAQHHDQLVWTVTSIVWAGNLVLLGVITRSQGGYWTLLINLGLCLLAGMLVVFVWSSQNQFRDLKQQKYARCKAIEQRLGMEHHSAVKYDPGFQTRFYGWISGTFLVLWLLMAIATMAQCRQFVG